MRQKKIFFMFSAIKKALNSFDSKPDTLIADYAPAITNGFMLAFNYESFNDLYRVMCWSHVGRNCEEKQLLSFDSSSY